MNTYGLKGQYYWFAFGAMVGMSVAGLAELAFFPQRRPAPRELPVELLIPGCAFVGMLIAIAYTGWLIARTRRQMPPLVPWFVPLLLGVIWAPTAFAGLRLCIALVERCNAPESLCGYSAMTLFFGLPMLFGEITYRLGQRSMAASPADESV